MRRRFPVFLTLVFLLLVLWFFYLGERLVSPLDLALPVQLAIWSVLAIPFACILWIPAVYWRKRVRGAYSNNDAGMLTAAFLGLAFLSFLFFLIVTRDVTRAALLVYCHFLGRHYFGVPLRVDEALYSPGFTGGLVLFSLLLLWKGRRNALGLPRVRRVRVPIRDLPSALEGFRVAQVSDLHMGRNIGKDFLQRVVSRVNELKADAIAITGDLVDGAVEELREAIAPLASLRASEGVYYVTGNHEYYWGGKLWVEEVRRLGVQPLINRHEVIARAEARLLIAGIPDIWEGRLNAGHGPDVGRALEGAPKANVHILLAHQPRGALLKGAERFDLTLSGHTHGGQFLPWTILIYLFQPFVRGLNRYQGRWVYVNRGTGYWGPPVRLGSPSEITLLTLTRA